MCLKSYLQVCMMTHNCDTFNIHNFTVKHAPTQAKLYNCFLKNRSVIPTHNPSFQSTKQCMIKCLTQLVTIYWQHTSNPTNFNVLDGTWHFVDWQKSNFAIPVDLAALTTRLGQRLKPLNMFRFYLIKLPFYMIYDIYIWHTIDSTAWGWGKALSEI